MKEYEDIYIDNQSATPMGTIRFNERSSNPSEIYAEFFKPRLFDFLRYVGNLNFFVMRVMCSTYYIIHATKIFNIITTSMD